MKTCCISGLPFVRLRRLSASGSTVITLKSSYLETLELGDHSVTVRFKDANDMKLVLTVKRTADKDNGEVRTGDESHLGVYIGLAAASLALIVVLLILLKKDRRKKNKKQ